MDSDSSSFSPAHRPHSSTTVDHLSSNTSSLVLCRSLRRLVSQNRRRFKEGGFDLDLTYITDRIIAMGYPSPSDTTESLYRNTLNHTVEFLEKYHRDHYKVFNLRGRYVYNESRFHGRVESFAMNDHHPPRLELMAPFCRKVHEWLQQDPRNVVAVHCKAGKGRTGVMICAYLTYINFYPSPRQNIDYYSCIRTINNRGVTIPSQRRYIYYFSHLRDANLKYLPLSLELIGVYVERPPKLSNRTFRRGMSLRVINSDVQVYAGDPIWISADDREYEENLYKTQNDSLWSEISVDSQNDDLISQRCYGWTMPKIKRVFLKGDVKIELFQTTTVLGLRAKDRQELCHLWLNTMFCCEGYSRHPYIHGDLLYPCAKFTCTSSSPCQTSSSTITTDRVPVSSSSSYSKSLLMSIPLKSSSNSHSWPTANLTDNSAKDTCSWVTRVAPTSGDTVLNAPGLNDHCPDPSVIYGIAEPPRTKIEKFLSEAQEQGLIRDKYECQSGVKSDTQQTRGKTGSGLDTLRSRGEKGPGPVRRRPCEHVHSFGLLEMDAVSKRKHFDASFKMYVVTRCIDRKDQETTEASELFMNEVEKRQRAADEVRKAQVEQRRRKLNIGKGREDEDEDDGGTLTAQRKDSRSDFPDPHYCCPMLTSCQKARKNELLADDATPIPDEKAQIESPPNFVDLEQVDRILLDDLPSSNASTEDDNRSSKTDEDSIEFTPF